MSSPGSVGGPSGPNRANIPASTSSEAPKSTEVSATEAQKLAAQSKVTEGSTKKTADTLGTARSEKPAIPSPNTPLNTGEIKAAVGKLNPDDQIAVSVGGIYVLNQDAQKAGLNIDKGTENAIIGAFKQAGMVGENGVITKGGALVDMARTQFTGEDGHLTSTFFDKAEDLKQALLENPDKEFTQEEFSIFSLLILMGKLQSARWDAADKMIQSTQANFLLTFDEKAQNIEKKMNIEFVTGIGTAVITAGSALGTLGYQAANIKSGMSATEMNTVWQKAGMIGKVGDFSSQIAQSVGKRMSTMQDVEMQMIEKGGALLSHLKEETKVMRNDAQSKYGDVMRDAMQIVTGALQVQEGIARNI